MDLAKIITSLGSFTHKQLQKISYYAQAWHWALYDRPLTDARFEAWVHGPVCPELYGVYKSCGWNPIPRPSINNSDYCEDEVNFVTMIVDTFGGFTGDELESMTHLEEPWLKARTGLQTWEASNREIDPNLMKDYYRKMYEKSQND